LEGLSVKGKYFDAPSSFGGALALQEDENTIKVGLTSIDTSISQLQLEGPYLRNNRGKTTY